MGIFSKFEGKVEDTFEGAANKMFDSPLSPVQIAKKAEKRMRREKIVGAGKQYAPTLYTVLVNEEDDTRLFGYYPTLAGETETYLAAKAIEEGLVMDGQPLVRFIVDESLKRGKFEVIAEPVASPIIEQLRTEEMDRYGIGSGRNNRPQSSGPFSVRQQAPNNKAAPDSFPFSQDPLQQAPGVAPLGGYTKPPLPQVPANEIDYSIDYGEYTFNSRDFEDYQKNGNPAANQGYDQSYNPAANQDYDQGYNLASPSYNPGVDYGQTYEGPNTVVFAPGSGNANPVPNRAIVRARLMNATDNQAIDLASSRLLMGRDQGSDIVVDDINASRTHAELRFEAQGVWVITDLGSTNGTLVNGREINAHTLRDGDYITIGMTNFIFIQAQ